jgi:hypothetical protein
MKKTIFLFVFIVFIFIIPTFSQVTKEKPLFAIGTEFLSISNDASLAIVLYNNTEIYIDTNNDDVWDFSFFTNESSSVDLKPSNGINLKIGSRIYSTKPIWLKQRMAYYNSYLGGNTICYEYGVSVPPISNLQKKYTIQTSSFYILSNQDTTAIVNNNTFILKKSTPIFLTGQTIPAKITSNTPIYVFSSQTFATQIFEDFYTDFDNVQLLILEDNTSILFDYDNDGNYDGGSNNYNKGIYVITTSFGAHIHSDKGIGIFTKPDFFPSTLGYFTYVSLLPSSQISNEYFAYSYSSKSYVLSPITSYATGIFSKNIGLYNVTKLENAVNENIVNLSENSIFNYSNNKLDHIVANQPFLFKETNGLVKLGANIFCSYQSTQNPSADIIFTQYPKYKNIKTDSNTSIIVRLFNTFFNTKISNTTIEIFTKSPFEVIKTSKISLKEITKDGILSNISFENVQILADSILIYVEEIPSNTYIEIEYDTKTSESSGQHEFSNTLVSYNADTWS